MPWIQSRLLMDKPRICEGIADMPEMIIAAPKGELLVRTLAMPADTNPSGDIFGGWLMG